LFLYSYCVFQCATTAIHLLILQAGVMTLRRVGVIIGGRAGISAEVAGTDGIAIPYHNQHHRRLIKGSILVNAILSKSSSSMSFIRTTIVTNRMIR
jgi:hypothetical protein